MKTKHKPVITNISKQKPMDWKPLPPSPFMTITPKTTREVSNAEFVKAWMTCKTNQEVAEKLGLTATQTSAKASDLRKKGVNLPKKQSHYPDNDSVEALNKLIAKYTGK